MTVHWLHALIEFCHFAAACIQVGGTHCRCGQSEKASCRGLHMKPKPLPFACGREADGVEWAGSLSLDPKEMHQWSGPSRTTKQSFMFVTADRDSDPYAVHGWWTPTCVTQLERRCCA